MSFDLVKKIFIVIAIIVFLILCAMHTWMIFLGIIGLVIFFIDWHKKRNIQEEVKSTIDRWTEGKSNLTDEKK